MNHNDRIELVSRRNGAKADLSIARQDYNISAGIIFVDEFGATRKMAKFCKTNGRDALIEALESDPAQFGPMRGHRFGDQLSKDGRAQKIEARDALKGFADKCRNLWSADEKLAAIERALGPFSPSDDSMARSRGGPNR